MSQSKKALNYRELMCGFNNSLMELMPLWIGGHRDRLCMIRVFQVVFSTSKSPFWLARYECYS